MRALSRKTGRVLAQFALPAASHGRTHDDLATKKSFYGIHDWHDASVATNESVVGREGCDRATVGQPRVRGIRNLYPSVFVLLSFLGSGKIVCTSLVE